MFSKSLKMTVLAVASSLFLSPLAAFAQPTAAEYGTVLNLSGKQRMLTQKMSKEILLIALDVDKAENLANLTATAALFDRTLNGLHHGDEDLGLPPTVSPRIVRQLEKIKGIWAGFHGTVRDVIAAGGADASQVAEVAAANLPLLKQMNKCVKLYERDASVAGLESDPGLAVTINLSGKQRMLTQKMSKEFLLVAFGHEREANMLNLVETSGLFGRTLDGLLDGDADLELPGTESPAIRAQLEKVRGLWAGFRPAVQRGAEGADITTADVRSVADANLPLLKAMNTAVGMYEKEAAGVESVQS